MASFPYLSFRALDITERLGDGRKNEALRMVIDDLEAGTADPDVQRIAANLLQPRRRGRGAPKQTGPKFWLSIGPEFEIELDNGKAFEVVREEIAARFGVSESHVENALRVFRSMRE